QPPPRPDGRALNTPPPPMSIRDAKAEGGVEGGVVGGVVGGVAGGVIGASPKPLEVQMAERPFSTEEYGRFEENPFLRVTDNPLSTFSIDVDRASYSNV